MKPVTGQSVPPTHHGSWLVRYGVAVLAVLASVGLRLALLPLSHVEAPFLLLAAAVLVSAAFGGLGPAVLATILGASLSSVIHGSDDQFFVAPAWFPLLLFLLEAAFISVLGARLQSARRRAEASEALTRQLEQRILDISDAERRGFGQDLHDGLGQHLTGVAFLSKALQQRLESRNLPEAADATKIAALVSESIGQTRALAKGLAPIALEDAGLVGALQQLAATTSSVFGIECACHTNGQTPRPNLAVSTHIYRIAQEAVNNAIRHGRAAHITIGLSAAGDRMRFWVEDDGVGLGRSDERAGMGLQIMDFRARMIGGNLRVERRDLIGGTIVTCEFPVAAAPKGP
jgi:signal transduction histidine kinase